MTHLVEPDVIDEMSTHFYTRDAWVDWTPTVTQLGNVTVTVNRARYVVIGNTVHIMAKLTVTGAGTAGNPIIIGGVPSAIQPAFVSAELTIGNGLVADQGVARYHGALLTNTSSTFVLQAHNTNSRIGVNPNFSLANTDIITLQGSYER